MFSPFRFSLPFWPNAAEAHLLVVQTGGPKFLCTAQARSHAHTHLHLHLHVFTTAPLTCPLTGPLLSRLAGAPLQVVYILDQVRALEREMTQRLEDAGLQVGGGQSNVPLYWGQKVEMIALRQLTMPSSLPRKPSVISNDSSADFCFRCP